MRRPAVTNPLAKVALFAAALVAVFAAGMAIGAASGPFDDPPAPTHAEDHP